MVTKTAHFAGPYDLRPIDNVPIHPDMPMHSGRFTSQEPNISNIPKHGALNAQVKQMRTDEAAKEADLAKGKVMGQLGRDAAAGKHAGLVQVGQRIARELAQHGPITIDDVTAAMAADYNVVPKKGKRQHQWKGSVFPRSEWICVGDQPSRQQSAHARPVKMWALRSWLKNNTLNGRPKCQSAFDMHKLYRDFKRKNPKAVDAECVWFVGEDELSPVIKGNIAAGSNSLYGIRVSYMPNTIGAIIVGQQPVAAHMQSHA